MKCYSCPAYSKKDGFPGCLALQHKVHSAYDGCNRSYDTIKHELWYWMLVTNINQMNKFSFWHVCDNPLDSHWGTVEELKETLRE